MNSSCTEHKLTKPRCHPWQQKVSNTAASGHITHTLTRTQARNARDGCTPRQMTRLPAENREHTKHFDIFNLCLKPTSFTTMMLSPTVVSQQGQIDWLCKSCPKTTTEAHQETRKASNCLIYCLFVSTGRVQNFRGQGSALLLPWWEGVWITDQNSGTKLFWLVLLDFFVQVCLFVCCWLFFCVLNMWN